MLTGTEDSFRRQATVRVEKRLETFRGWVMGGLVLLAAGCAIWIGVVDAGAGGLPGTVRAHKTVGGQFAVAAVNATVSHPHAIYLRLVGRVDSGTIVVACSRDFSISSNSYEH